MQYSQERSPIFNESSVHIVKGRCYGYTSPRDRFVSKSHSREFEPAFACDVLVELCVVYCNRTCAPSFGDSSRMVFTGDTDTLVCELISKSRAASDRRYARGREWSAKYFVSPPFRLTGTASWPTSSSCPSPCSCLVRVVYSLIGINSL